MKKFPKVACVWAGEIMRQLLLFPAVKFFTSLKVSGANHLSNLQRPFILIANHTSHLDTLALLTALPLTVRLRLRVAAAADYFFNCGWKSFLMQIIINAFPFSRKGDNKQSSLDATVKLIQDGNNILLFPEGTRSPDGHLQPFKRGAGRLAINTGTPIVPAYIGGAYAVMPKGANWPRRHPVTISFGSPLYFSPDSDPDQVAARLEQAVRELAEVSLAA